MYTVYIYKYRYIYNHIIYIYTLSTFAYYMTINIYGHSLCFCPTPHFPRSYCKHCIHFPWSLLFVAQKRLSGQSITILQCFIKH